MISFPNCKFGSIKLIIQKRIEKNKSFRASKYKVHVFKIQVEVCAGDANLSKAMRMSGYQGKEFDDTWRHVNSIWYCTMYNDTFFKPDYIAQAVCWQLRFCIRKTTIWCALSDSSQFWQLLLDCIKGNICHWWTNIEQKLIKLRSITRKKTKTFSPCRFGTQVLAELLYLHLLAVRGCSYPGRWPNGAGAIQVAMSPTEKFGWLTSLFDECYMCYAAQSWFIFAWWWSTLYVERR